MKPSEKTKFISSKISEVVKPAMKQPTAVMVKKKPQLSQRDQYANAMNRAQRNGGSNGVGVGY